MMKNPFKDFQEFVKKTPRNAFDLSYRNNLTLPWGYLVPDLVLDVTAGDSVNLDAAFAFNFAPMMFPIQTPVRINQYFFYVRYRNTWENYMDFRYGNKSGLTHPYLKKPASFFKTCGLADYMGVPTTLSVGESGVLAYSLAGSVPFRSYLGTGTNPLQPTAGATASFGRIDGVSQTFGTTDQIGARSLSRAASYWLSSHLVLSLPTTTLLGCLVCGSVSESYLENSVMHYVVFTVRLVGLDTSILVDATAHTACLQFHLRLSSADAEDLTGVAVFAATSDSLVESRFLTEIFEASDYQYDSGMLSVYLSESNASALNDLLAENPSYDLFFSLLGVTKSGEAAATTFAYGRVAVPVVANKPYDIGEHPELNPFCSVDGGEPVLRLNALPFRAYEQTYNAYFRNERVEPFIKDGAVEYNDFGTTYADGADTTDYELKSRNWELDFLTSCLPTPQQGTAPVVGVDSYRITFADGETGRNYHLRYQTDDKGVLLGNECKFEETDVPGNVRTGAVDLLTAGFTIEQLREGNAMTLWVEKNLRRGLRYRDQLKAHTGIDLDWDELELPEFLGGFSHYVDVSSISSSASTDGAVLGDIAGQAAAFKRANHKISHFFREDGVVLGLICIVPQPVYSQLLPKFYLRQSPLDYYNSEFSHLGMQPVPYAEVAPVQMYSEMLNGGTRTMQTVFGYNRPNYDMVSRVDEAHGLMRTEDRDFVLMRTFADVPELGSEFLHVDGHQLNDVFAVHQTADQIAKGQVAFKIWMKRPVPSVGEPRLE